MTRKQPAAALGLRVCLAVFGVAALAFAVLWTYAVLDALQPDFNPKGVSLDSKRKIGLLGYFGVVASLIAAGSAFAYAKTAVRTWIIGVVVGCLSAAGIFLIWVDIWEYAGGVG